jgi:hypothetical protein
MVILERIMQLKQQGFSEPQIIRQLRSEGVSAREINESLSQSTIKNAIAREPEQNFQSPYPFQQNPSESGSATSEINPPAQMQPSIMSNQEEPDSFQSQERVPEYETQQTPSPHDAAQYPVYDFGAENYNYYPEYQSQSTDIETINDIARQIVEEETQKIQKQTKDLNNFKKEVEVEIKQMNQRLLKVEREFDDLKMALLGRIGEQGDDIKNISKEIRATQDSFSKILNPLTDNIREMQKINRTLAPEQKRDLPKKSASAKKSDSEKFGEYLR